MKSEPNFKINSKETISKICFEKKLLDFQQVALYIKGLPYGRNKNRNNAASIFTGNCGTCSTKHAFLKTLAIENNFADIKLIVALFKMNEINTPKVGKILKDHHLDYIPEAHCFLRFKNQILDYTSPAIEPSRYKDDILEEIEIDSTQISDLKVKYHKQYLVEWLQKNPTIKMTIEELWTVRELCIRELSRE